MTRYQAETWDNYAGCFASVTTPFQMELYNECVQHLKGDVVDLGCGAAKVAAFLAGMPEVMSYTGVDCSKEMVAEAESILARLPGLNGRIVESTLEQLPLSGFTSAVSTNSYYAWPEPVPVLEHIHHCLAEGAVLVLATPNENLDMVELLRQSEKALLAHPHFELFKKENMKLAGNGEANFVKMDTLVSQLHSAGFNIVECHQRLFRGGINFIVSKKGD